MHIVKKACQARLNRPIFMGLWEAVNTGLWEYGNPYLWVYGSPQETTIKKYGNMGSCKYGFMGIWVYGSETVLKISYFLQ